MNTKSNFVCALIVSSALALSGASSLAADHAADAKAVIKTYGDVAQAMYEDAFTAAKSLQEKVNALIENPTEDTLSAARAAWKAARVPYQQTEGYRFGNAAVDDWEGKVNAWPLDEGLIDYVDASYGESSDSNPLYAANVIANAKLRLGKKQLDARKITPDLIQELHEGLEVEANVATGYHAIEFLLWGQDLNGSGPGAGKRPATDFDKKACTGGHCDRRSAYLKAATDLLVSDLQDMAKSWAPKGAARKQIQDKKPAAGLASILTGLGSLSYGELGGERIKLGLMLHDPEEEHDCFSDNTHNSHYYDQVGMMAIWEGKYKRIDGSVVEGPGLAAFAATKDGDAAKTLDEQMAKTLAAMQTMKDRADSGKEAYDQMIGEGNAEGNAIVQNVVDNLVAQTRAIEKVVSAMGLEIKVEGSDSLDAPEKVGKG
jgi:putative iron-regulated protein